MKNALFVALEERFNDSIRVYQGIPGGDINNALELVFERIGKVFVKYNAHAPADLFEKESVGLSMLKHHTHDLRIPNVLDSGILDGGLSYLALEFLEKKASQNIDFESLGRNLAQIHRVTFSHFGLDHDNYIGLFPQKNEYKQSFASFYWENRILPQLKMALQANYFTQSEIDLVEASTKHWNHIFPDENPSLLHGDLWIGNVLSIENSGIALIDPAIYYGHREVEVAFTSLFGGFSDVFYHAYNEAFPLEQGFKQRRALYQLYPVLVHVNLFGGAYVAQARSIFKQYV